MENYKKYNNGIGWLVFTIASIVYIMTLEPTASFWDCGEFIATAFKLEVGHPPGAPLWMMIARVFGMLAMGDVSQVAFYMNLFSGLSSSFSILFLFWSITHLAKKMVLRSGKTELTGGDTFAIMSAGAIGALAYTFSDSFWFSAVEAEVYANSSLFTAAVFWLILKWESIADEAKSDRYLIFIAYLMGLSIGVHLLNLLAIPAIALVYYFKKYEPTLKGGIIAFIIGFATLIFIQYGIIQKTILIASKFEWVTVNGLGLPKHSGVILFVLLLLAAGIFGMKKAVKSNNPALYKSLVALMVIIFGYSSFAMIVIRSSANTPMDENNPEDVFSLLPYLNREQYGDRPLLFGHTFQAPTADKSQWSDGNPTIYWDDAKSEYYVADIKKKDVPAYQKEYNMLFPRMYSRQAHHKAEYERWSNFEGKQFEYTDARGQKQIGTKPTFMENMSFFFNYQIRFMYWRYFMWNFSGRQNDIQGHGEIVNGNWISGVEFIDQEMVGGSKNLPDEVAENPGRNSFYMLPFILGLIGLFMQLKFSQKDFIVTMVLFLLTGFAIIVFLNQTPMQPRERDYAYAASFYAFAIWIGLGVIGLYNAMTRRDDLKSEDIVKVGGSFIVLGVIAFALEFINTNTHEFSYSLIYIGAIGTGITLLAKVLGGVMKSEKTQAFIAFMLTIIIPLNMAAEGWDDHDRSNRYSARDFAINYLESCAPNAIVFTNGDNDTFPLWYVQEVENFRTDVRVVNLSLLNTDWYITQMKRKAYDSEAVPFSLNEPQYRQGGSRDVVFMGPNPEYFRGARSTKEFLELKNVMKFIGNDNRTLDLGGGDKYNYSPSKNLKMTITDQDIQKLISSGAITPEDTPKVVKEMKWTIKETQLYKNKLMILDLLATNNWERPVYFAITVGGSHYINLEPYFQLEGLANRILPIKNEDSGRGIPGKINTDIMYNNFMNKFKWGNLAAEGVYLNQDNRRMCVNFRSNFSSLVDALINEGKTEEAILALDKCLEVIPDSKLPYDYFNAQMASSYAQLGEIEKAQAIVKIMKHDGIQKLDYYFTLNSNLLSSEILELINRELRMNLVAVSYVYRACSDQEKMTEMDALFNKYGQMMQYLTKFLQNELDGEAYEELIQESLNTVLETEQATDTIPVQ
jgi:tetratricopeptide (TPR) repeat protein